MFVFVYIFLVAVKQCAVIVALPPGKAEKKKTAS